MANWGHAAEFLPNKWLQYSSKTCNVFVKIERGINNAMRLETRVLNGEYVALQHSG